MLISGNQASSGNSRGTGILFKIKAIESYKQKRGNKIVGKLVQNLEKIKGVFSFNIIQKHCLIGQPKDDLVFLGNLFMFDFPITI